MILPRTTRCREEKRRGTAHARDVRLKSLDGISCDILFPPILPSV